MKRIIKFDLVVDVGVEKVDAATMWVAREDSIGIFSAGNTPEEACANLKKLLLSRRDEMVELKSQMDALEEEAKVIEPVSVVELEPLGDENSNYIGEGEQDDESEDESDGEEPEAEAVETEKVSRKKARSGRRG